MLPGAPIFKDLAAKTKSSFLLWDRCATSTSGLHVAPASFYPVQIGSDGRVQAMLDAAADVPASDPPDPDRVYGNYVETCRIPVRRTTT